MTLHIYDLIALTVLFIFLINDTMANFKIVLNVFLKSRSYFYSMYRSNTPARMLSFYILHGLISEWPVLKIF